MTAAVEKLSDTVGLVHEYATFCYLKKAGAPRWTCLIRGIGTGEVMMELDEY